MNNKTYIHLVFLLALVLLSSASVLAAPPFQTSSATAGCDIEYPKISILKQNEGMEFNFHVINTTQGNVLTNKSVSCMFHLFNYEGKHIGIQSPKFGDLLDFEITMNANNFTRIGEMGYLFQCNNTQIGCFISVPLTITSTGYEITTAQSSNIILGISLLIIIAILLFIFGLYAKMPIKLFSLGLSILLIAFTFGLTLNALNNSIGEYTNITSNFSTMYYLIVVLLICGGIGVVLWLISFAMTEFNKTRGYDNDED